MRECRRKQAESQPSVPLPMSEGEKEAFEKHAVKIFISYFKRASNRSGPVWRTRCLCMLATFVDSGVQDFVSSKDIQDPKLWNDSVIYFTSEASSVFHAIEQCAKFLLCTKKSIVNTETVFVELMLPQYNDVLEAWNSLTAEHLSETDSLFLLKDFIAILTALSMRVEGDRLKREEEERKRLQRVELRTSLKKNT